MPRRRISFDVAVNTPSAQREANRLASIFQSRLRNIQVGTAAGSGGGGGGGGGGAGGGSRSSGMPGSSLQNLFFGSAQFALAGMFYQMYSNLPRNIAALDGLATANKRATASFTTLAGGVEEANAMIDAYIEGTGNVATRTEATTQAMRLFNIGMADNAREMRVFTTLSRGMSQALGRPTDYIQEQLSLALANQSLLRFDQLGLSIERHQDLVAELSEKYPDLTREMVFQNAMIIQATERYYTLANAQEALASTTEIASRELGNYQAILAEVFSTNVSQPFAASLAQLMGADDWNLRVPELRNSANRIRQMSQATQDGDPLAWMGNLSRTLSSPFSGQSYAANKQADLDRWASEATLSDALADSLNALQAAENSGIQVTDEWASLINQANDALRTSSPEMDRYSQLLVSLNMEIENAINPTGLLDGALLNLGDSAEVAAGKVAEINDVLLGVATGMVGKLIESGASPDTVRSLVPSEDEILVAAKALQESAEMQGDVIDQQIALEMAREDLLGDAENWLDAAAESERASKRASTELEQAAKASEKAFLSAADAIVDTYDKMLRNIPGLFTTSKVTDEDLKLADLGLPVNYADDALRRLEDVAFNKTKRDDVDLGQWAQALRLPDGTDPQALAIYARRAWESGELWANPENINRFLNIDAAKGELRGQELGALGQQNLEAFFGIGTDQGNEFLRVFGVKALDPVEDGLITEITTRGPIMGETLASAIHTGFNKRSLELPWVSSIMSAIDSAVGKALLGELSSNASGELADVESLPTE